MVDRVVCVCFGRHVLECGNRKLLVVRLQNDRSFFHAHHLFVNHSSRLCQVYVVMMLGRVYWLKARIKHGHS